MSQLDERHRRILTTHTGSKRSKRSPDGAKRNPGFPHSAALHAGYTLRKKMDCTKVGCFRLWLS
jgi:hypothetical protein